MLPSSNVTDAPAIVTFCGAGTGVAVGSAGASVGAVVGAVVGVTSLPVCSPHATMDNVMTAAITTAKNFVFFTFLVLLFFH